MHANARSARSGPNASGRAFLNTSWKLKLLKTARARFCFVISVLFRCESEKNAFISPTSTGVYFNKGYADFEGYVIWYFVCSERKLWHEEGRAIGRQLVTDNPLNYTSPPYKTKPYVNKNRQPQVSSQNLSKTSDSTAKIQTNFTCFTIIYFFF